MDAQSLCRYSCCSATLRRDVRDAHAWQLVAAIQAPRPARDATLEAERDAIARMQSHARRRLLADCMAQGAQAPVPTYHPNSLDDFTYFVRITVGGRLLWEGDLAQDPDTSENLTLSLAEAWSAMKQTASLESGSMVDFLSIQTVGIEDVDIESSLQEERNNYIRSLRITVVAIRKEDQAMVALGHFWGDTPLGMVGAANKEYSFRPRAAFLELPHFWFRPWLHLYVTHDPNGEGTLRFLEMGLDMYCGEPFYDDGWVDTIRNDDGDDGWIDQCHTRQFRHVLSYLAGVPHLARGRVLDTIKGFYEPEQN